MPGLGPAPQVAASAFTLKDSEVSKALQSPRGPVYITVTGKRDPYVPTLDEVKDRVREDVINVRAAELSRQRAAEIASALRSAKDFAAAAKAQGLEAKDTRADRARIGAARHRRQPRSGQAWRSACPSGGVSDPIATRDGYGDRPRRRARGRDAGRVQAARETFRDAAPDRAPRPLLLGLHDEGEAGDEDPDQYRRRQRVLGRLNSQLPNSQGAWELECSGGSSDPPAISQTQTASAPAARRAGKTSSAP